MEAKGMVLVEKCNLAPELASCLNAFLRCLPPMPQGCPWLRPGPGPGSIQARGCPSNSIGMSVSIPRCSLQHLWPTHVVRRNSDPRELVG